MTEPSKSDMREVLQELVACNDLKAQAEAAVRSCSAGSHALLQEYERRKALAWKAARAYLAQPEPQDEARMPREPTFEMTSPILHIRRRLRAQEKESAK